MYFHFIELLHFHIRATGKTSDAASGEANSKHVSIISELVIYHRRRGRFFEREPKKRDCLFSSGIRQRMFRRMFWRVASAIV